MCGRHSWCTSITERSRVVGNNSLDSMIQVNSECYQDEPGTQEVSATKMRVPRNQIRIQFGDLATRRLNRQGKLCLCHFSVYLGVSRRLQRGPNLATRCWRNQLLITRLAQKISTNQRNRKGIAYQQICFRTLGYLPQNTICHAEALSQALKAALKRLMSIPEDSKFSVTNLAITSCPYPSYPACWKVKCLSPASCRSWGVPSPKRSPCFAICSNSKAQSCQVCGMVATKRPTGQRWRTCSTLKSLK